MHGGKSPGARAKAQQRQLEAQARKELAKFLPDRPPVDNPLEEFPRIAARALAWADVVEDRLAELGDVDWVANSLAIGAQLNPIVALFTPVLAEARQCLTAYARLNIDERLAKVTERQLDMLAAVLVGSLEEAQVEPAIEARVLEIAERKLRELGA